MPFGICSIMLSDGTYEMSYSLLNDTYRNRDKTPKQVKVFYNDGTTTNANVVGEVFIKCPENMYYVGCNYIDGSRCYCDSKTCEGMTLSGNSLLYIDNNWVLASAFSRYKHDLLNECAEYNRCYCFSDNFSEEGYDILLDYYSIDFSKQPCININGLLVKLLDYRDLFPGCVTPDDNTKYKGLYVNGCAYDDTSINDFEDRIHTKILFQNSLSINLKYNQLIHMYNKKEYIVEQKHTLTNEELELLEYSY